jgi:hypothetical protein
MGIGWVILIIVAVLAVIISNITLLRDSKDFHLPDSYLKRKQAEEAYLQSQAEQSSAEQSSVEQSNAEQTASDQAKAKPAQDDPDKPSGFY